MTKHRWDGLWCGAVAAAALAVCAGQMLAAPPAAAKPSAGQAASTQPEPSKQAPSPLPPLDKASWIWSAPNDDVCQVRTSFTLDDAPTAASILITADNGYELFINGATVGYDIGAEGEVWSSVERYDVTARLARGKNVIGIRGTDLGRIGQRRAAPTLLGVVGDLTNATDVRHAAAEALGRLADPASLQAMNKLAQDYPEFSIRRALLRACAQASGRAMAAARQ